MSQNKTCGERYAQLAAMLTPQHWLFQTYPAGAELSYASMAIGFVWGQAEKVASGACAGFMIRPAPEWRAWQFEVMQLICTHYGLTVLVFDDVGEHWGILPDDAHAFERTLRTYAPNSPEWHTLRAHVCGIRDIDIAYHTRRGYQVRCEPSEGEGLPSPQKESSHASDLAGSLPVDTSTPPRA